MLAALLGLMFAADAIGCSMYFDPKDVCPTGTFHILSMRVADEPSRVSNIRLETDVPGPRAERVYRVENGSKLEQYKWHPNEFFSFFAIDRDHKERNAVLLLKTNSRLIQFSRWAKPIGACATWEGSYLKIGKGQDTRNGSMKLSQELAEVDEVLSMLYVGLISAPEAKKRLLSSDFPEFSRAVDSVAAGEEALSKFSGAAFKLEGKIFDANDENEKALASFEFPGEIILKFKEECRIKIRESHPTWWEKVVAFAKRNLPDL